MNRDTSILAGITVVIVGILIAVFVFGGDSTKNQSRADQATLLKENSHRTGAEQGKVELVEFGDFQCPACAQAFPMVKQLILNHSNDLTFVFRNFPITSIHKNAQLAALAGESSAKQGKFWDMYNKLYENQSAWSENDKAGDVFTGYAKDIGINVEQFKKDIESKEVADRVASDVVDATTLGVNATPTFYFNGVKYSGSLTLDNLESAYQKAIAK